MASKGTIPEFKTLKECLEFLEWLNKDNAMQGRVATELEKRLGGNYKNAKQSQIQVALSKFLGHVSNFYKKLCKSPHHGTYRATNAQITESLLQCIPKFFAALYMLRYNVDDNFKALGGGIWKDLYPGGSSTWGGDMQKYLYKQPKSNQYGVIPGGFRIGEVRYDSRGYYQGYYMAKDLETILNKHSSDNNVYLDVFATSVLSTNSSVEISNTANALAMVSTFCEIVAAEPDKVKGGEIKVKLDENLSHEQNKNCICWDDLQKHCIKLQSELGTIFKGYVFSFTGFKRARDQLYGAQFAKEAAKWLKYNLGQVRENLGKIQPFSSSLPKLPKSMVNTGIGMPDLYARAFADYFNKNLFPHGFTFDKTHFRRGADAYDVLKENWHDVINLLKKEKDGSLDKIVEILNGTACPPQRENEKDDKEAEKDTQNQGKKAEGAQNQGKKAEGAQNQGKKAEGTPRGSPVSDPSASSAGHSYKGETGPKGMTTTKGDSGPAGSLPSHNQQIVDNLPQSYKAPSPSADTMAQRTKPKCSNGYEYGSFGGRHICFPDAKKRGPFSSRYDENVKSAWENAKEAEALEARRKKEDEVERERQKEISTNHPLVPASHYYYHPHDPYHRTPHHTSPTSTHANQAVPMLDGIAGIFTDTGDTWMDGGALLYGVNGNEVAFRGHPVADNLKNPVMADLHGTEMSESQTPVFDDIPDSSVQILGGKPVDYSDDAVAAGFDGDVYDDGLDKLKERKDAAIQHFADENIQNIYKQKHYEQMHILNPPDAFDEVGDHVEGKAVIGIDDVDMRSANYPVVVGVEGAKLPNDYDSIHDQQDIANVHGAHTKVYERRKSEDEKIEARLHHAQQLGVMNSLNDLDLGETVELQSNNETHVPLDWIENYVSRIPKPIPPVIETLPHESSPSEPTAEQSTLKSAFADSQSPPYFYVEAVKSLPTDIEASNITVQDPSYPFVPDVSLEITKHPKRNLENGMPPNKEVKSVYIGVNPDYYVIDDDLEITKATHAERKETVDLEIDVPDRTMHDSSYDLNIDEPPPPLNVQPLDPIGPATPAINLIFPPIVDPKLKPPEDFDKNTIKQPNITLCLAPWATSTPTHGSTDIPETELFPAEAPRTVRDMLQWLAGLRHPKHHSTLTECFNNAFSGPHSDPSQLALSVNGSHILPQHVIDTIHLTAMFAGSVLTAIAPRWRENVSSKTVQPRSSEEPDCCALLCQLRDYVYASHHQLAFLKAQCDRDSKHGGWQDYKYGSDLKPPSPLQLFLTDDWDSDFKTRLFDPCNLCRKSRIRMGFRDKDLSKISQPGSVISTILTPSCGGDDPLLTLCSYLNCLTRRTPRTTGELVSYFHHFAIELHNYASKSFSPLGSSLTTPHADCPDWDRLGDTDLDTVRGIRGSETLISKNNSSHDNAHPRTLSTLVGCGGDATNCPQRCSPITYRAYALYSQSFAHTYLSWTVYLPDRLWESLLTLHYDLLKHCGNGKCTSLYSCTKAMPLFYLHGFTPPEVGSQPKLTCQQVIAKLKEIVNGKPIASLMTAMDNFLYGIREPFILTIVTLWSLAFLIFANTMLYRIDVLHIRSHLIRTKASHLIDVKALLSDSKKMMSLYDASYFDDDPNELLNLR